MNEIERTELMAQLDAAKIEFARCMSGVDPEGCVRAAQLVTTLRLRLKDDKALFAHFLRVIDTPDSIRPLRSRRVRPVSRKRA